MAADAWDDDRIGIPRAGVLPVAAIPEDKPRSSPVALDDEPRLRPGETDLGRPPQVPSQVAPLSDDDRRRLREADEVQALRDLAEAEELLASDPAVLAWAGWFAHPLAGAILLGAAGALGLFLYSQSLTVLGQLASLPVPVQYAGYVALGILAAAVLASAFRLLLLYARLQRNRQVRVRGLEELQTRTRLRWLSAAKSQEAKARLEGYLKAYPMDADRDRRALTQAGIDPSALAAVRDELLDPARFASTGQWFERFRDGFQAKLDAAADARVSYWANRAMLTTAVAPNGLVDSLATAYFGFAMVTDLCRVYNLKAGRAGTAVLLGRVFFNAYLAGNLGDWEKLVEDQYDHLFEQGFRVVGAGVGGHVASKFVGKIGAKATTGYLNRVLLGRLGRYACRLLRPAA